MNTGRLRERPAQRKPRGWTEQTGMRPGLPAGGGALGSPSPPPPPSHNSPQRHWTLSTAGATTLLDRCKAAPLLLMVTLQHCSKSPGPSPMLCCPTSDSGQSSPGQTSWMEHTCSQDTGCPAVSLQKSLRAFGWKSVQCAELESFHEALSRNPGERERTEKDK